MLIPLALLAISALVIIHEFGHYIVARAFGMRVVTFSIGFGPPIVRWRPRGSETVFQIALIPVLAYVQIAGMSPRDVADPRDRGSYQNATPLARFATIAAGPLANYVAAGIFIFLVAAIGGEQIPATRAEIGNVMRNSAAASAGLRSGDVVRSIDGRATPAWSDLVTATRGSRGHALRFVVDRAGREVSLAITPRMDSTLRRYTIGVEARAYYRAVSIGQSVELAIVAPAVLTAEITRQLSRMFRRQTPVQLVGPVGIVSETVQQARAGWRHGIEWLSLISLQLFLFNLLPIPALDGGRLIVLGYEMVTRRRPNPKFEARVLAVSLMLMLGLFLVVTFKEIVQHLARLF